MIAKLDRFIGFLSAEGVVLDAGCGIGNDTRAIAERGFECVGIDIDAEKIYQAQRNTHGCIYRQMDARLLNYPTASFDGIWADTLFYYLSPMDAVQTVNGFARVLKPGGVMYLSLKPSAAGVDHLKLPERFITLSHLNLITESGFRIISQIDMQSSSEKQRYNDTKCTELIAIRAENPSLQHEEVFFEENCLLCPDSRFSLNRQVGLPTSGSLLWGNDDLYLMPDIAPLIEGHLLLTTTKHYMCYGACPTTLHPAILSMQRFIRALFAKVYQTPTIFMEHGPAQLKKVGVCIDHAHWHCLPASIPIQQTAEKLLGPGENASIETLQQMYQKGQSYIYIEETNRQGRAYMADVLPSQYLRQVTVSLLDRTDWEWQTTFKRPETLEAFRNTMRQLIPSIDSNQV